MPNPISIPLDSLIRGIRYLSFQGGGMKGIGDVGALKVLEETGVLSQIEAVAGSSVGGIMAMLVAIGCTAEEIKEEMLALDFEALQDKAAPGWIESMGLPLGPLHKVEDIGSLILGSSLGLFEGDTLCNVLTQILVKKGLSPNLTFQDLEAYACEPGSTQKNLILTGSDISTEAHGDKLRYFNATETPHMSIVQAVRISASFPLAFKPVKIKESIVNEDGTSEMIERTMVDGGLLENLPDVFNKPPYYSPSSGSPGNPKALALSFASQDKAKKELESGLGLLHALYKTKLSENDHKRKYGSNLVEIDTKGMGTLEFNASEAKKQKLVESGREAVERTFETILKEEEAKDIKAEADDYRSFSTMSIDDLVQMDVALEMELEAIERGDVDSTNKHRIEIKKLRVMEAFLEKDRDPSISLKDVDLEILRKKAKARFEKIQFHGKRGGSSSEEDLRKTCFEKKEALEKTMASIEHCFDDLQVAKQSLVDYGSRLKKKIKSNQPDRLQQKDGKGFFDDLEEVQTLLHQRSKDLSSKGLSFSRDRKILDLHTNAIEKCLKEKITKYQGDESKSSDPFLAYFFQDILERSPHFRAMPLDPKSIDGWLQPQLKDCDDLIQSCEKEMDSHMQDKHRFESELESLSTQNDRGNHYHDLLEFNKELDKCIYKKTRFLDTLNNFFVQKAPMLSVITTPFFECISMVSFIALLPVAIPAVGIAKTIGFFSKNEGVKMAAAKTEDFFRPNYLGENLYLKAVRDKSKEFQKAIKQNYETADHSEMTYLFKLHARYLKDSGITFESIVQQRPGEKSEAYHHRVEKLKSQFEKLSSNPKPEKLSTPKTPRTHTVKRSVNIKPEDLIFFKKIQKKLKDEDPLSTEEKASFRKIGRKFKQQSPKHYRVFKKVYAKHLKILRPPVDVAKVHSHRHPTKRPVNIEPEDLIFFQKISQKLKDADPLRSEEKEAFMALGAKFKQQSPKQYQAFEKVYAKHLKALRPPVDAAKVHSPTEQALVLTHYKKHTQAQTEHHRKTHPALDPTQPSPKRRRFDPPQRGH